MLGIHGAKSLCDLYWPWKAPGHPLPNAKKETFKNEIGRFDSFKNGVWSLSSQCCEGMHQCLANQKPSDWPSVFRYSICHLGHSAVGQTKLLDHEEVWKVGIKWLPCLRQQMSVTSLPEVRLLITSSYLIAMTDLNVVILSLNVSFALTLVSKTLGKITAFKEPRYKRFNSEPNLCVNILLHACSLPIVAFTCVSRFHLKKLLLWQQLENSKFPCLLLPLAL